MENKKAILLLSGGIDSTTVLAWLGRQGWHIYALSFDYGQRHRIELDFAQKNARAYGAKQHHIIRIDYQMFASQSSLTNPEMEVQKYDTTNMPAGITDSFVPARNLIFLSHAAAYAEIIDCSHIFVAFNQDDAKNFPDCTPDFVRSCQETLKLQTALPASLQIHAPLIHYTKAQVVALAQKLGVNLHDTMTCYSPTHTTECGKCLSCQTKQKALVLAQHINIDIPTLL